VSEPQEKQPQQKKELSGELRILIASLLSMAVIVLWIKFFAPKAPLNAPQSAKPAQTAPATPGNPSAGSSAEVSSAAGANSASPAGHTPAITANNPPPTPARADAQERTVVVESNLYRVEFSNRGAVVHSWQLKKYMDDAKPPHILDLVHPKASEYTNGWPFAVVLDNPELQTDANSGLYQVSVAQASVTAAAPGQAAASSVSPTTPLPSGGGPIQAPAILEFTWSNGHLEVTKRIRFEDSYVVHVETSVQLNGTRINSGLSWLGGFGDLTVPANPAQYDQVLTFYSEHGSLTSLPEKKLEGADKWGPGNWQGGKDYAGIQDRYFSAVFLAPAGTAPGTIETRYWKAYHPVPSANGDVPEPISEVAVSSPLQPLDLRVYVGPKDYDILKKMNPPLQALVNFGWLEIIADPLFHGLKWIHNYVPNWGWSIVVLTLVINMLLFPLRISGYRTTLKMQRVAPEIKQINDKYKKYKMNDPKRQEANKEIMAIYSREGINPIGGCIPQLLQLPIWYGLYRALQGTIELRHAPWFGWIKDLSAKDPYYILPLLMGVSMYFASKMTPMTSTDPQQQAMMKFMPLMMSGLFLVIPYPSGLAVYILTSGIVGVAQQWYLNRKHPVQPAGKLVRAKKS
jgi:YidC/Oxa1 family membrane protein insertase